MSNFSTVQIINAGRSRTIGGADSLLILRDVVVTNGMGLKSKADATSDDIAITLADNGGLSTFQIKDLGTNNVMVVDSDGNVDISGNLNVTGSIVSRDEERVLVADNFLDINFGHVSTTALSGGIAVNYVSTAAGTNKSIDTGSNTITFTAVAGVARPKLVAATGSAIPANTYVTNDIVQISGTLSAENDGFYVVSTNAVAGTIEFLSTVKTTPDTINFKPAQVNFTGEANTSGTVTISKVKVTVLQVKTTDGTWETATGDVDGDFASPGDLGGSSLQEAYVLGNTIGMTNAAGDFDVSNTSGTNAISLDAAAASNFTVAGANLTLATTTSGTLGLSGAAEVDLTSIGLMDVNAGASLDIDVTGSFDMLASTTFSIDGTGASNVTATTGGLTLSTATSGTLAVSAVAALAVSGADDSTINITGTTKTLDIDATGAVSVNSSAGVINIGNDDFDQAINIGTDGVRTVTVGANASTTVVVNAASGTAGVALQVAGATKLAVNGAASSIDSQYALVFGTLGSAAAPNSLNGVIFANASGVSIAKGKIVALNASGQLQLADANSGDPGDSIRCPAGAPISAIADGQAGPVAVGGMAPVFCTNDSDCPAADQGKPVYLTATAGAVSTTAPTASGNTVFQVGILQAASASNLAYVLWQPMFVADII
jgi:hypothetical protein